MQSYPLDASLTLAEAARGAVGQRANHRLVAGHDLAESVAIAGEALRDQFGVSWDLNKHAGCHHMS